jgi:hypothetical protein
VSRTSRPPRDSRGDVPPADAGAPSTLAGLGDLKKALERARREAAAREAAARAAEAEARRDHHLFTRSVGAVTPLTRPGRAELRPEPPPPEPLQRQRDEAAALRASLSDDFDVESLLDTDAALSFRRPGLGADVV